MSGDRYNTRCESCGWPFGYIDGSTFVRRRRDQTLLIHAQHKGPGLTELTIACQQKNCQCPRKIVLRDAKAVDAA